MKLTFILAIADRAYTGVLSSWDGKVGVSEVPSGDSLASFVASELAGIYDESASNPEQLRMASNAMTVAMHELEAVRRALDRAYVDTVLEAGLVANRRRRSR